MSDVVSLSGVSVKEEITSETLGSNYKRIGEIAEEFNVTLRTLRHYEDKGLLSPKRQGSLRLYSHNDCTKLKIILLARRVGFSLSEVKEVMDLYKSDEKNTTQLNVALEKARKQIINLQEQRRSLDEAIRELDKAAQFIEEQLIERSQPLGEAKMG